MNIAAAIFAITAIVLYGIDLADTSLLWMCDGSTNRVDLHGDNCRNVALFAQVSISLKLNLGQHYNTTTL